MTRRMIVFIVVFAVAITLVNLTALGFKVREKNVGRFQISASERSFVIDTTTGSVWRYARGASGRLGFWGRVAFDEKYPNALSTVRAYSKSK